MQACEEGRIDIVKYIISHPAFDPEKCSKVFNSELDNIEMVRLLFEDKRFNQSFNNNLIDKMRSGRKMRWQNPNSTLSLGSPAAVRPTNISPMLSYLLSI